MTKFASCIFLLLLFAAACRKVDVLSPDCIDQFFAASNMVRTTDPIYGCKFYVGVHDLDGEIYFHYDHTCADMLSMPVDCSGNPLCASFDDPLFGYFLQNAVSLGIFGVQPE